MRSPDSHALADLAQAELERRLGGCAWRHVQVAVRQRTQVAAVDPPGVGFRQITDAPSRQARRARQGRFKGPALGRPEPAQPEPRHGAFHLAPPIDYNGNYPMPAGFTTWNYSVNYKSNP